MSERFMIAPAVYLILLKENKVLLQRRYNTGWADGLYTLLSGHVDSGEIPSEAMLREANEEGNITIETEHLQFSQTVYRSIPEGRTYVDFFFVSDTWEGEPKILETDKADDLAWFPLTELPENILDFVRQAIVDYRETQTRPLREVHAKQL
jgi:8-oxo-dGTP diphosphatase